MLLVPFLLGVGLSVFHVSVEQVREVYILFLPRSFNCYRFKITYTPLIATHKMNVQGIVYEDHQVVITFFIKVYTAKLLLVTLYYSYKYPMKIIFKQILYFIGSRSNITLRSQ